MKKQMKKMKQKGFTLIELISVIVILGILAAAAAPQFVDLSSSARDAACDGVHGAVLSSAVMNIAGGTVGALDTPANALTNANIGGGAAAAGVSGGTTYNITVDGTACTGNPFTIPSTLVSGNFP